MIYNIKTKRRNIYSQQISNTTASHEIRNIVILHSSSGAKPISIKAAVIAALNVKGVETARTIGIVLVIVQQGASMSPTTVSHSHSIQILPLQVLDSVVSSPGRLHFHGGDDLVGDLVEIIVRPSVMRELLVFAIRIHRPELVEPVRGSLRC